MGGIAVSDIPLGGVCGRRLGASGSEDADGNGRLEVSREGRVGADCVGWRLSMMRFGGWCKGGEEDEGTAPAEGSSSQGFRVRGEGVSGMEEGGVVSW